MWKTELGSDEHGYLAEDIFKRSAEDVVWFLLAACNKMSEERDEFRKELLSKKEPALDDLEDSQPIQMAKRW